LEAFVRVVDALELGRGIRVVILVRMLQLRHPFVSSPRTCRRWRSNPSGKCSQERLTRGTVTSTIRKAAHPPGCARCGAGAGCSPIKYQSLAANRRCGGRCAEVAGTYPFERKPSVGQFEVCEGRVGRHVNLELNSSLGGRHLGRRHFPPILCSCALRHRAPRSPPPSPSRRRLSPTLAGPLIAPQAPSAQNPL